MAKVKTTYICQSCGYESPKWMGRCSECGEWNSFVEEVKKKGKKISTKSYQKSRVSSISDIPLIDKHRMVTGISEFDRVVGGGIVKGSIFLIGGSPGIGKSTLLLQICHHLAGKDKKVLYVTGEESLTQIKIRARRLSIDSGNYLLLDETDVDSIIEHINDLKPDLVVVDSVQTLSSTELESLPGNVSQVRYCGYKLTECAKKVQIPIFMIGHVTKQGSIAGPRVLEHLIDGLLIMEGDQQHLYRILRGVKNRYGSTSEVGLFEMTDQGVREVKNPSELLISQRSENTPGSVVTVSMEGTRPLMVEVQALVSPTSYGIPQRTCTGVEQKRLSIILAVLEKRVRLKLGNQDVFVNAAGGIKLREPGVDLSIALSTVSSLKNKSIESSTAVIGEVGLTGEVRGVSQMEKRVSEAERLGFKQVILPKVSLQKIRKNNKIALKGVLSVNDAVDHLFKKG
ncbi:MAG: DNA repair protein RadA [bacterium]